MSRISSQILCVLFIAVPVSILSGCGGNSTSPDDSSPLLSDQFEQGKPDDVENYDAEASELLMIERVLDGSFEALIAMNEVYSQGALSAPYLGCVDSIGAFPLIEYDCSEATSKATLLEFGFPVSQLQLVDDPFCREQLASAQGSLGCVITTLHVQFEDNWQFQSQYGELGDAVKVQVQLFQGGSSPLADLATFNTTCELTLVPGQSTVRNDEQLCRQATQNLLTQIEQL